MYTTNKLSAARTYTWVVLSLTKESHRSTLGFFMHFQFLFGSAAIPREGGKGLYLSVPEMVRVMKADGAKTSTATVERHLKVLTDLGILSKAKISPAPRYPCVYFINEEGPHENDELAKQRAAELSIR